MKDVYNFDIPILFLVFNRLDTTKQVFEEIRKAAPKKLYVASDGPRDNREGEKKKVEAVRDYVLNSIDWNCELITLFLEKNLGCGKAVSNAITWFFENEEMGIILEDDCLPSQSFFPYCKELLGKYKNDTQIYHITGYNPLTSTKTPYSYYFARNQHCWGWATWKRAWKHYNFDITDLEVFIQTKKINKIFNRNADRDYWLNIFKKMEKHEIDTWDYQWTYSIFNNNGLCINPAENLITNIGFGPDATHTITNDLTLNNKQRFEITKITHPDKIIVNTHIVNEINRKVIGITKILYYKTKIKQVLKKILLKK
ncbi:MAG: nucleotide-diphospho-sugar transferase [Spirochaetes bacterium]|nr:nucleotide-diphospho-sugar transferase [Spirochaetota bacterium]